MKKTKKKKLQKMLVEALKEEKQIQDVALRDNNVVVKQ